MLHERNQLKNSCALKQNAPSNPRDTFPLVTWTPLISSIQDQEISAIMLFAWHYKYGFVDWFTIKSAVIMIHKCYNKKGNNITSNLVLQMIVSDATIKLTMLLNLSVSCKMRVWIIFCFSFNDVSIMYLICFSKTKIFFYSNFLLILIALFSSNTLYHSYSNAIAPELNLCIKFTNSRL